MGAEERQRIVEPTPFLWIMAALWAALAIALIRLLPRLCRGEPALANRLETVFGALGAKTCVAMISALPLAAVVLLLSATLLAAGLVREIADGAIRTIADVITLAVALPFLGVLVAFFAVVLFNRPKAFVPPPYRERGGFLLWNRRLTE